jgi:hypothetical protein
MKNFTNSTTDFIFRLFASYIVNCKFKINFIFWPVLVPFSPPSIPTHAELSPPHKRAFSLFITEIYWALVKTGPELIICDESHCIKNDKTSSSGGRKRHLLPSTLATRGVNTGYPDTGYPTLATQKADTDYPDTGYLTLAIPNLLPLENGS